MHGNILGDIDLKFCRLFGVTTLDVVRASTFVSEVHKDQSLAPKITVPVVGGHSGVTVCCFPPTLSSNPIFIPHQIVPLLSQSSHPLPPNFSSADLSALVNRIQFGGDEVVKAKDGAGSATLSMAYAGAEFAAKVLRAVQGEKGIVAPSYVNLAADKSGGDALKKEIGAELDYFSSNVELGVSYLSGSRLSFTVSLTGACSLRVWLRFIPLAKSQQRRRNLSKRPFPNSKVTSIKCVQISIRVPTENTDDNLDLQGVNFVESPKL
jgi:hypothetical protein